MQQPSGTICPPANLLLQCLPSGKCNLIRESGDIGGFRVRYGSYEPCAVGGRALLTVPCFQMVDGKLAQAGTRATRQGVCGEHRRLPTLVETPVLMARFIRSSPSEP
jgi:hypothetical protein